MKVYKLTVSIIDLDEVGEEEIVDLMENIRYPNRCISPAVVAIESRDIGEWSDDHPLNKLDTSSDEFNRLFSKKAES